MEEYFYEVDLSWKSETTGALTSHGLQEIEVFSLLKIPRQQKKCWTPEHLLAASVTSSFMTTFLHIAKTSGLGVIAYQSQCFVKLKKIKGKYIPIEILLSPVIELTNDLSLLNAYKCIDETERLCPVKNTLKINVEVHPQFKYNSKVTTAKVS
jgi:organic hydroperoxide reductase OsmC/OhrA